MNLTQRHANHHLVDRTLNAVNVTELVPAIAMTVSKAMHTIRIVAAVVNVN